MSYVLGIVSGVYRNYLMSSSHKHFKIFYFFTYLFLAMPVFVAVCGLSLVTENGVLSSCGARVSHCSGFSCWGAQALGTQASVALAPGLWSTGSIAPEHGLSCSAACVIFPDQGSNLCTLHFKEDS